jgi:hypothetical protein
MGGIKTFRFGNHGALMGTIVVPKFGTDYDKSSPPDDKMQARIDENLVAYCDLINSMDTTLSGGRMAFQLVTKTVTKVFPNGHAHEGFTNLQDKLKPSSELDCGTLMREFYAAQLRPNASADDFITWVEGKHTELDNLDTKIEDDNFSHSIECSWKAICQTVAATRANDQITD